MSFTEHTDMVGRPLHLQGTAIDYGRLHGMGDTSCQDISIE